MSNNDDKEALPANQVDQEGQEEELDFSPFWGYLQTEQGHKIVEKLIDYLDMGKRSTLLNSGQIARLDKLLQAIVVLSVVIAVSALTYLEKFTPSLGVLFGTLVGYIYGRKN